MRGVRGLLLVVVVVVGLWAYLEGQQWVFRLQAHRLLADVQRLQVQRSGWDDVQRFRARWGRWGDYRGTCDATRCMYGVILKSGSPAAMSIDDTFSRRRLSRVLQAIGLRATYVSAGVSLQGGRVLGKFFMLDIDLPSGSQDVPDLAAVSSEGPQIDSFHSEDRALHPYRSLTNGGYFEVAVTPKEAAAEKAKLMAFRLDCITALRSCMDRGRLLPEAYREVKAQRVKAEESKRAGCSVPYWVIARDEQAVVLVDVLSAKRQRTYADGSPANPYWILNLKVDEVLKGKVEISPGQAFIFDVERPSVALNQAKIFPSKLLIAGRPIGGTGVFADPIGPEDCAVVAATPTNLAEAKRGVTEDFGSP